MLGLGDTTAFGVEDEELAVDDVDVALLVSLAKKLGSPVNQYQPMGT